MEQTKKSPMARVWELAKWQHSRLFQSVVLAFIGVAAGLIPYYAVSRIIILLLYGQGDMEVCIKWLGVALVGSIAKVLFSAKSTSVSHIATFQVLEEIRKKCISKLSKLSMGTLLGQSSGQFKIIIVDQIESMEKTLAHLIPEMTANALMPLGLIIMLFFVDWRMALVSLITMPLGMVFMMAIMKSYPKQYEESVRTNTHMNSTIVEYINGIEVIKSFNQGKNSYEKYTDSVIANARFFYHWMRSCQWPVSAYTSICPAVLVTVLPIGLLFYGNGSLKVSDFITIMILSLGIIGPLLAATNYTDDLAKVGTIVLGIDSILQAQEQQHLEKEVKLDGTAIELEHVSFSYENGQSEVLKDICLYIKPNTMTAFVGPSGSGKSTITKLIAGFWDVEKGNIYLGGKNLKEIPLSQIAENIAYVSQDNFLFDDTIRENIRMGREGTSDEEVEQVAKATGCDEFICKLEYGYDTVVGGSGAHLSGGERQRIAIARAMLKDSPIVILDEATAYMDPENEAVIQKAVAKLVEGKTLILIAHRLSTITDADQIVVVRDGRIESKGKHGELLQKSELYSDMWKAHIGVKDGE